MISKRSHVLVLGNHFAHKGSEVAALAIANAFPDLRTVALGENARQISNLTVHRAGTIEPEALDRLFSDASLIVLPSHVEGFGLGFMHALAAGRPIVARRIAATEEILASLDDVEGVHLFDDDRGLVEACTLALQSASSRAKDFRGKGWDDWAEGLTEFCLSLTTRDDIFGRLVGRLKAGQRLHCLDAGDEVKRPPRPTLISSAKPVDLDSLLAMEGRTFVEHAYATLLRRPVDEGGLQTYLNQLETGVHKVDILHSLSTSPEGRLRDVKLRGLPQTRARLNRERLPLLKRMFSA